MTWIKIVRRALAHYKGTAHQCEGRGIDEVSEGGSEEGVESLGSLATGVDESLEEDSLHGLDLGVGDDLGRRENQ